MSDWKLDLHKLHRIGGEARVVDWPSTHSGRRVLRDLGLIEPVDDTIPRKSREYRYRITARGLDVIDGRLMRVHRGSSGPAVWRLSWLSSLPRAGEIRLAHCEVSAAHREIYRARHTASDWAGVRIGG